MVSQCPIQNMGPHGILPLQMDHEEVRDFLKKKAENLEDLDQT